MATLEEEWKKAAPITDDEWAKATPISEVERTISPQQKATEEPRSFLPTMISNIPSSGVEFLKSIITPITHPVATAKGVGYTGLGFLEKLVPGEQESEKYADAMIEFMKDRYGGLENIKKTAMEDPVGMLADVSTLLTGFGGAARATLSASSKAGKVMQTVGKVGKAVEPLSMATKTLATPLKFLQAKTISPVLGLTTGVGTETVRRSTTGSKPFMKAVRGKIEPVEIVVGARSALDGIKNARSQEYVGHLSNIQGLQNIIDITPVRQELTRFMSPSRFNITVTPKGKLDFTRSTIQHSARKEAAEVISMVKDWGSTADDLTPRGMDILKRKLDDFYSENKNTRAMVEGLRSKVKEQIVSQVPEYATMTRGYEKASSLITEIQKGLSLGTKSSIDSAITRFRSVLRDDAEFRRGLVETLEKMGGKDLLDSLSGMQMKSMIPSVGAHAGLAGRIAAGGLFSMLFGITPESLAIIATTSPRIIAEVNNAVAQAVRVTKRIPKEVIQGTFQAGRVQQQTELSNAHDAIAKGVPVDQVKTLYKTRTGQEYPE